MTPVPATPDNQAVGCLFFFKIGSPICVWRGKQLEGFPYLQNLPGFPKKSIFIASPLICNSATNAALMDSGARKNQAHFCGTGHEGWCQMIAGYLDHMKK